MWIKICGLTTPEAVAAALSAGADALGFVFSESPRRVTPRAAAALAAAAAGRARRVAVTRAPSQALIEEILADFAPDVLQSDAADFARLTLPATLERLPVLRSRPGGAPPRRLLFEGAHSGRGERGDWEAARELARATELVLAGGLSCENVVTAIRAVAPFGVDVSSGVEERPGHKSPALITRFIATVRGADAPGKSPP